MQGKQIIRTQRKTGKPSQGRGENASVVCFRELSLFFFFSSLKRVTLVFCS